MNRETKSVARQYCQSPAFHDEVVRSRGSNTLCGMELYSKENGLVCISVECESMNYKDVDSRIGDHEDVNTVVVNIVNIINGFLGFDIGFSGGAGGMLCKGLDLGIQDPSITPSTITNGSIISQGGECVVQQQQWHPLQQQQLLPLPPQSPPPGSLDSGMACDGCTMGQEFQSNHSGYNINSNGSGDDGAACYLFSKQELFRAVGYAEFFIAAMPSLDIQKFVVLSPHVYDSVDSSNDVNNENGHGLLQQEEKYVYFNHI